MLKRLKITYLLLPLAIVIFISVAACAPSRSGMVAVTVNLDSTLHTMQGGIGASWHAMEDSLPVEGKTSHGGSGWGANPDPMDDQAWHEIYRHAQWLGLDFCRVELEQRMYEPEKGKFDWNNPEMRILYRILDWCEKRDVDVFLQQMWSNTDWNAYPQFRSDPIKRLHSAPFSLDDFAEGIAGLAEHLVKNKGYTCIKWLSINNEPGHSWSWWQRPPNEPALFTPALEAVRKALDRREIALPLSAPDWTDSPPLEPEKIDFDPFIGAYDIHCYYSRYDWMDGEKLPVDLPLSVVERRLGQWANWAHERNKPFFLTELGSMVFGWRGTDNGPNTFMAALKDAELVIRGLNVRVDGFNKWSFINRGNLDGQWQMINTWDIEGGKLLEKFTPKPDSYFVFGLVPRFIAKYSKVLATTVSDGSIEDMPRVFAAAVSSPQDQLTLLVVNDAESDWEAEFSLSGLQKRISLYKYQVTVEQSDNANLKINPVEKILLSRDRKRFTDNLPALSLTLYTTYNLSHSDGGIITE